MPLSNLSSQATICNHSGSYQGQVMLCYTKMFHLILLPVTWFKNRRQYGSRSIHSWEYFGRKLSFIVKFISVAFNEDSDVDFSQQDEHDGNKKGRDRVCRNNSSHLVSRYAQNQTAIKNHLLTLGIHAKHHN